MSLFHIAAVLYETVALPLNYEFQHAVVNSLICSVSVGLHLSISLPVSGPCDRGDEIIHCTLVHSLQAHQQPITVMQAESGRVVTGSQDHTLKV